MVDIIIKIPNSKLEDFRNGFLKVCPNESGETDLKWIQLYIRQTLKNIYITGKTLIAQENTPPEIDDEIVEE